jgi:hypothetical protein
MHVERYSTALPASPLRPSSHTVLIQPNHLDGVPEIWILDIGHILESIFVPVDHDPIDRLSGILSLVSLNQGVSANQTSRNETTVCLSTTCSSTGEWLLTQGDVDV